MKRYWCIFPQAPPLNGNKNSHKLVKTKHLSFARARYRYDWIGASKEYCNSFASFYTCKLNLSQRTKAWKMILLHAFENMILKSDVI